MRSSTQARARPSRARPLFPVLVGLPLALGIFSGRVVELESHACRFWGLVGSGYPQDLIADHLRDGTQETLRHLGGYNRDGWALAGFLADEGNPGLDGPLIRRGGPQADHPTDRDYDLAVGEMNRLRPKAAIAHIRNGTSGHWGIPDPHPFIHEGMLFAHNGTASLHDLLPLLTSEDPDYLQNYPPDYVTGFIDSELYFLYLLKYVREHRELDRIEALRRAVRELALKASREGRSSRLNFVATSGDTLFALRHAPYDTYDPVRYSPRVADGASSPYWIVASQPVGTTIDDWSTIPERTLAVFVPDRAPLFMPVDPDTLTPPQPTLSIGMAQPNPARDCVTIPITLPAPDSEVRMKVWDATGRLVWEGRPSGGAGQDRVVTWNGEDLRGNRMPSGTYYCRVTVDRQSWTQTVSLIR